MEAPRLRALDSSAAFAGPRGEASITCDPAVPTGERGELRGHVPGEILGRKYQIVQLLGQGGMGTVWRARSLLLDIDVAIKVLYREHADLTAAERLLREARALARLEHPGIVRVFDFGETDAGEPFLVMEVLEGLSLAHWLDEHGTMSATQAVQMLLPIAAALAGAHAHGIVHRDVKPENIIAVPDGLGGHSLKIVDFGIAKLVASNGQVLTQQGTVLGSLEYMSPEQADGRPEVGEQTDVWALCVVLYELITGRRPFQGPTITAMIFALYSCAPTPTTCFGAGDEELWDILARGLRKSPEARWPTMLALGHALATWAEQRGITTDASGTLLSHNWRTKPSGPPPVTAGTDDPIPATPVVVAPSGDDVRSSDQPAAPRLQDTMGTGHVAGDSGLGVPRTSRWTRALLVSALIGVGVVAAGLRGNESASAGERPAAAIVVAPPPGPAVGATATATTASLAPAEAPSVVVSEAAAPEPRRRRAAAAAPRGPASMAMPLPSRPGF